MRAGALLSIPGGRFQMGSPGDEPGRYPIEGPQRAVSITGFQLGWGPVAQAEWRSVMGADPGCDFVGDALPADSISWFQAIAFCNARSALEGLGPAYAIDGERVRWDRAADGYRLPTEAEWEYACRAGTTSRYWGGDAESDLRAIGWVEGDADGPRPVGMKPANPWGLVDTHGNVSEWCWDWYAPYPRLGSGELDSDPAGPEEGAHRIGRGGCWFFGPREARAADRAGGPPRNRLGFCGFRVARGALVR